VSFERGVGEDSPLLTESFGPSSLPALPSPLGQNVVDIKDETGEFLLHLAGGKVIDTKAGRTGSGLMGKPAPSPSRSLGRQGGRTEPS
jgi:hypothetical protein